jgi:hypothetical protein
MNMKNPHNDTDRGRRKYVRKTMSRGHFIHHIPHKKYDMIYLLNIVGLSPGGSTHIHTNNTQNNTNNNRTIQIKTRVEECGP